MKLELSDEALVRDLGFRILECEFGDRAERKKLLGEYYKEAQEVANLIAKAYGYDAQEKQIARLEQNVLELKACLWKLGYEPYRQLQKLSEQDLRSYDDYLLAL